MVAIAFITTIPDTSETTIIQTTPPVTKAETKPPATTAKTETPIPTTPVETKTATQPPMRVELMAAITGFIDISAYGAGSLDAMKLNLTSKSGGPLEITVSPGTIFDPQSSLKSSMVVTSEKKILLEPLQTSGLISVDAASLNMQLDVPAESDALTLNTSSASGDLRKLVRLSDFQNEPSFRIQQFAIWTITDNPGRDEYVGIGYFGMGSGPSDEEMEIIRLLFQKAGISTEEYQALKTAVYVELIDAKNIGLVEVNACGVGSLEAIKLSLTSKSDDVLEIAILPGTIFDSQSVSIQGMVVITDKLWILYPRETVSISVGAACANMRLSMPDEKDTLTLRMTPASGDLMKLLNLPDFHKETYRVQQFAIWTITDNPGRDDYIGIGFVGMASGPSNAEIERIRVLFQKAGIPTDKYKTLV